MYVRLSLCKIFLGLGGAIRNAIVDFKRWSVFQEKGKDWHMVFYRTPLPSPWSSCTIPTQMCVCEAMRQTSFPALQMQILNATCYSLFRYVLKYIYIYELIMLWEKLWFGSVTSEWGNLRKEAGACFSDIKENMCKAWLKYRSYL